MFNDTYGHGEGNKLLAEYAKVIADATGDIPGVVVFRERGDEFVIAFLKSFKGDKERMRQMIIEKIDVGLGELSERSELVKQGMDLTQRQPSLHTTQLLEDHPRLQSSALRVYDFLKHGRNP